MMLAGKYDELVTIQTRTATPDSTGGRAVSWATYCRSYANVRAATGKEIFAAGQTQNPIAYVVEIPDTSTDIEITPRMRVLRGDSETYLQIKNVRKSQRLGMEILLDCENERPS